MPVSLTLSLSIRTLPDVREAARRAAALCGGSVAVESGLTELLVNAVEHGNLGIDHACKARLLATGTWEAEVERRLAESAAPACVHGAAGVDGVSRSATREPDSTGGPGWI